MMRLRYKIIASFVFGCLLIWLLLDQIDTKYFIQAMQNANVLYLTVAFFFFFGSMWSRILRWKILLDSQDEMKSRYLWSAMLIGYFVNIIIPARFGEFVRSYYLSTKTALSVSYILGTIVIEKILDIGMLLALFLGFCYFFNFIPWFFYLVYILGVLLIALILFVLLSIHYSDFLIRLAARILEKIPKIQSRIPADEWLESIIKGFHILRNPVKLVQSIILTIISWGFCLAMSACIVLSLGISPWFPASVLSLIATNLGQLIPITPAYIGIYQYMAVMSLGALNVDPALALSYGIVSHVLIFGTFTIAGGVAFWYSGIDILDLYSKQKERK